MPEENVTRILKIQVESNVSEVIDKIKELKQLLLELKELGVEFKTKNSVS